ncbi:MAG: trigger factor [Candidatus Buchananbacteria bacterium]|nr:trigger factor [Candidatus Buchananbacteria bacterium]
MNYQHEIKKLPKNEVEMTVTIPNEELKSFLQKAAENISQSTKIEGFRPGKASIDAIKQRVGEMKLYEEAAGLAVEKSYIDLATKEKLEPLGSPKVEFVKLAPENDFVYKATIALIPEVKLGDWQSIRIKEPEIKITDEQVNKVLEELRESRAKETLEDKKIEKGDKVELDFDVFRDNVPIEGGAQKKYPLVIGSDHFIPGFEKNLIGLKKDEEKEFELNFPEEYHNKDLAGKPAKFKVKILNVYKRELPELNDEFAKELGQESLAKLKQQIKQNLEHEESHKAEEKLDRELLEKLIAKSEFGEIPDMLLTSETDKMIQELESNISQQGLKFDDYLKHLNKTVDQLKLDFASQALKRVQSALIMRQIFFDQNIEIPEAEIDKELEQAKAMYQNNPEIIKQLESAQYRDYVRNLMGNRKVMEIIKQTCITKNEKNPKIKHNHE